MRTVVLTAAILAICFPSASLAQGGEADFLERLEGRWSGSGSVRLRASAPARKVTCVLSAEAHAGALSMQGDCRALVIASRRVGARIKVEGERYSGTYTGPEGTTSLLSGRRSGNRLNLSVRWAKQVNGDRKARMEIASLSNRRMRLMTIDTDPKTGEAIVTSNIELARN
jgi:hypothetical protein